MALGVLNNLSAVYAENNLNNTSNSLQTVLQQLSSGSKINSGSDDAAGLSLINGLKANSTALTQSTTNATEGVGLLQVADGALSQVTSLLNRAVTLATESSNGTLSTNQQAATDEEYQSILAEINNIGSTTTYNQTQVFSGNAVNIYTGDSSSTGSSINQLHFSTLSSSSLGETSGTMSYSNGSTDVFLNLSTSTTSAQATDSLVSSSSIKVTYWDTTTAAAVTKTLSSADGTVQGLITAINNANLGISASFGTAKQAGTAASTAAGTGNTGETGIIIQGNVTSGTAPTAAGDALNIVQGTTGVYDSTAGQSSAITFDANTDGTAVATTTYMAGAGINLKGSDLSNTSDAETALGLLNEAISSVAAQDGYLGAQINTLNSVSSVMTTQQENVLSAQNAVQATDYASAASSMSKYEILSQTGISALAQANSVQQEVTKLLQ